MRDKINLTQGSFPLESNIFEPYFKKFPEKRPTSNLLLSNLSRRYIAWLELEDSKLKISDIKIPYSEEEGEIPINSRRYWGKNKLRRKFKSASLDNIFSKKEDYYLSYFNGFIILIFYKSIKYWKAQWNYFTSEEDYFEEPVKFDLLLFKQGTLINSDSLSKKEILEFRDNQFSKFKQTKEYHDLLVKAQNAQLKNNKRSTFDIENFEHKMKFNILKYTKDFLK